MLAPFLVGLDVGQQHDPAALAIAQRETVTLGDETQPRYLVRHLERFELGTAYPTMVKQCQAYLGALPHLPTWRGGTPLEKPYRFLVDATAVGRPVVDMFRHEGIPAIAVTMTHGERITQHAWNDFTVPKRALVAATIVAMQQRRLLVAKELPHAATFVKEAQNFQYRLTLKGNDQYGAWREGTHDDVLFSVMLLVWYGEQTKAFPHQRQGQAQTYEAAGSPHSRMTTTPRTPSMNPFQRGI
jgi:hypothetical protein